MKINGYSLIEIMVALLIFGIAMLGTALMCLHGLRSTNNSLQYSKQNLFVEFNEQNNAT